MARESPVRDGGSGGNGRAVDRRSLLKLAGVTAGSIVATGAASASNHYEVIEARGQTIDIASGETFENVLFDLSTGQGVILHTRNSTNWTIRNVGFQGYNEGEQFRLGISDSGGGESLVENLYLGDGSSKAGDFVHGPGAIFLGPEHSGHITFRHCNVQGYPNNGFYCSNGSGTVRFESCYAKNNGVANFRCSTNGDVLENCVAYNDNTNYGWDGGYSEENGRPLWAWPSGPITLRNSHFAGGPYRWALVAGASGSASRVTFESGAYDGGVLEAQGSTIDIAPQVGRTPDLSVPEGCPTSAVEAASGGSESGSGGDTGNGGEVPDPTYVYELDAEGIDEPTDYYLEIEDGQFERSTHNGAVIEEELTWISDDGTRAAGRVQDARHAWEFGHLLEDVTVEGEAEALVDGRPSSLDRYPRAGATGDGWKGDMPWHEEPTYVYEIVAAGEGPVEYYLEIEDGQFERSTHNGAVIEEAFTWVSDDGTRAAGRVEDARHAWAFGHLLEDVTIQGEAEALVDGRPSNLDRYPREGATGDDWKGDMPWQDGRTLVIDGVGQLGTTDYEIHVDGSVTKSDAEGAIRDEEDRIDGGHVVGSVSGWRDAYTLSGDLVALSVDGDAAVRLDGEPVDPDDYGDPAPRVLTVVGGITAADYELVVDGDVEPVGYDASSVTIEDGVVSGTLERSIQRFRLAGSLESVTADADVGVYLDGEPVEG